MEDVNDMNAKLNESPINTIDQIEKQEDTIASNKNNEIIKIENSRNCQRDGMNNMHVYAYSVGHFNNDLCAA